MATAAKQDKSKTRKKNGTDMEALLKKAPKAAIPLNARPMLATLVDKPFDSDDWLYEIKWDGYRALGFINKGKAELKSRNDKLFTEKFYPVAKELKSWKINAVIDGEIVVPDKSGISSFGALQNWRSEADGDLLYYVFDILWYEGRDLRDLPLTERKAILEAVLPQSDNIRYSQSFAETGSDFFEAAKETGLEGIIAKKADSIYETNERSKQWLKIKANKRQEMVIGGFTRNDDSAKLFSALLVGTFSNGKLHYAGKVGTGFNARTQEDMMKQFKRFIVSKPPFDETPDINKPSRFRPNPPHATATWLKPELVCEVSYTEITSDGIMRHPSFEGMRIDKKAKDITMEKAKKTSAVVKTAMKTNAAKLVKPAAKKGRSTFLNPADDTQVRQVNGHEMKFTNLSKVFWPKEKYTKRDVLNYYYQVAPYIMPYLEGRPQSMYRHPNGINGKSFYFKDVTGTAPDWIKTYPYRSESDGRLRQYLVPEGEDGLLYMANLGCIEMNPWHSRADNEDYPDWCIIDLDPAENTFRQVIEAARVTNEILESIGITSYPKTSGSTGMHIYIPLGAKYTYEQSKEFARLIAQLVHEQLPRYTSIERIVKARKGKMYIDFLQNRPQATISSPYSIRPKPGATVSMPLHWEEVKPGLKMTDFTIKNALERIKSEGDIFKPVLGKGINLIKAAKLIEKEHQISMP